MALYGLANNPLKGGPGLQCGPGPSKFTNAYTQLRAPSRHLLWRHTHWSGVSSSIRCSAASNQNLEVDWDDLPLPAGDLGLPLVGQTFEWLSTYNDFYRTRFERHGKVFKARLLGQTVAVIADNAAIRRLLASEHKLVESYWPQSMQTLLGEKSILRAPAIKHFSARRLLNQAFTPAAIAGYTPTMVGVIEKTLDEWASQGEFKAWSGSRGLAFDVAATVLMGRSMDKSAMKEIREEFDVFVAGLFSIPVNLPFTQYGKALKARKEIMKDIEGFIADARAAPEEGALGGRRNALQLLLSATNEDGTKISDAELKDQILTQLFAGHETTGNVMTQTMLFLEANPTWLERMREEQRELVKQYGPSLTPEVMEHMPCVDATIKETLRVKHPVGGGIWRRALEPLVVDGYRIPKGWTLELALQKSWENASELGHNADRYDPTRWLPASNAMSREEPKSFIPWGAGPRTCLGMPLAIAELRAIFASLARNYKWSRVDPNEAFIGGYIPALGLPINISRLDTSTEPQAPAAASGASSASE